jgi:hypothetical protein
MLRARPDSLPAIIRPPSTACAAEPALDPKKIVGRRVRTRGALLTCSRVGMCHARRVVNTSHCRRRCRGGLAVACDLGLSDHPRV